MSRVPDKRPIAGRPRPAALLLLAAALVAGCGGSGKKDAFRTDFKPIDGQLVALGSSVGQTLQNASRTNDAALARAFTGFVVHLQGIKARIDKLDPPSGLAQQVRVLSSSVSRLIVDLGGIAAAARAHDATAERAATAALVRDSPAVGDSRRALARKTGLPPGP